MPAAPVLALETYYVEAYRIRALWGAPRASESDAAVTAWIMVLEESLEPLGARIGPHSVVIRAWRDFTERALSSAASPKFDSPTRDHLVPPRARYPERRPASWIVPRAPRSLKKWPKWCCRGRRRALASFGAESAAVWRADRVAHVRPTQGEAADATDPPQGPRFRRCVAGSPRPRWDSGVVDSSSRSGGEVRHAKSLRAPRAVPADSARHARTARARDRAALSLSRRARQALMLSPRSAARSRSPPPHATSPRSRRRARPRRRAPTRPAARTCTRAPSRGPHLVERQPLVEYPHRSLRPLVPTSNVLLV